MTELALSGITKRFGDLTAVDAVDLTFESGEVHAVLGENGAGKSTLMNIASGFLAPDAGAVSVDGRRMQFRTPRDAVAAGVGMVHQHFRLVDRFTVAENLAIGAAGLPRVTSGRELAARAEALAQEVGLAIAPDRRVSDLSTGEKQRVEITRTLSRGARVLILDEPTAVLTPQESAQLIETLRSMAGAGTTVVFISHKLDEVMAVADRVSVMRRGALVETLPRGDCDVGALATLMVGKEHQSAPRRASRRAPGEEVLRLEGAAVRDAGGLAALAGVDLSVHAGEIVGVAGVAGNGQRELEEVVTGLRSPDAGTVEVCGTRCRGVRQFISAGVAHIPEDRNGMGLIPSEPVWRNAILRRYRQAPIARGPLVRGGEARRFASELAKTVDLSTSDVAATVQGLSGGNAQKLLAGRELEAGPRVLVAVNPTQGLDVGAAAALRAALAQARERGVGILLISADLDEVLELADRVVVLYEGAVVGETRAEDADRDVLGLWMGGATRPSAA